MIKDDRTISDALTEFLAAEGFNTELAAGKAEAFVTIEKNNYELLIVDVSLPDGNGF
ncbi:MAG: response regulator [Lachnospiraceae bacterium]|nr:response regulator [Lachnospiraceae bacterium]